MSIDGEITKHQIRMEKARNLLSCVLFGGVGFGIFCFVRVDLLKHHCYLDPMLQIAALGFFPLMGAIAFVLTLLSRGWDVVQFSCDDRSFRYRKLSGSSDEARNLSEVATVKEVRGRYNNLCGYTVAFRDGVEVFLSLRLPNCRRLADWLFSHMQTPQPVPKFFA